MRTYGTNTEVTAANFVAQVLAGLHYMHQNGVIHRDVKAANLMVDKAGKVVIGDFGLAKELFAGGEEHSTVGTPHWRAPQRPPPARRPAYCYRSPPFPHPARRTNLASSPPPRPLPPALPG
jgi:serine/threonine protein kinase